MTIKYEIKNKIVQIGESKSGWIKEFNLVSWNEREPVYDLRDWGPNHEKMGKGITLKLDEVKALKEALNKLDI